MIIVVRDMRASQSTWRFSVNEQRWEWPALQRVNEL